MAALVGDLNIDIDIWYPLATMHLQGLQGGLAAVLHRLDYIMTL